MEITVNRANPIRGEFRVPGDKSISHRALLLGSIAEGTTVVRNLLDSHDTQSSIQCVQSLGIEVLHKTEETAIRGKGLYGLRQAIATLDARNSGTTFRLLSGILAGFPFESVLTGDESLRRRPMKRIIEPLEAMGAKLQPTAPANAPLTISGKRPLRPISYTLPIPSAQVKSAILLAGLYAEGSTTVFESSPTRDHTERMLGLIPVKEDGVARITVEGGTKIPAGAFVVPGDISSALFLIIAAALVPGSDCTILNVGLNPSRSHVLDVLKRSGVDVLVSDVQHERHEPQGTVRIRYSPVKNLSLHPAEVHLIIDEIPALAVLAACSGASFSVRGGAELRVKESDRIALMVKNLRTMGIDAAEYNDGFAFEPNMDVLPARIETGRDHRIAMAFGIAGLIIRGGIRIGDAESADVSFPGFWKLLSSFSSHS